MEPPDTGKIPGEHWCSKELIRILAHIRAVKVSILAKYWPSLVRNSLHNVINLTRKWPTYVGSKARKLMTLTRYISFLHICTLEKVVIGFVITTFPLNRFAGSSKTPLS
jgi:hypothetical protein